MKKLTNKLSNLRLLGLVLCGLFLSACSQDPEVVTGPFIVREGFTYDQKVVFYDNGQLQEKTNYKDGKQDGLWEFFDRNGNLTKTETWENGEVVETNLNP